MADLNYSSSYEFKSITAFSDIGLSIKKSLGVFMALREYFTINTKERPTFTIVIPGEFRRLVSTFLASGCSKAL